MLKRYLFPYFVSREVDSHRPTPNWIRRAFAARDELDKELQRSIEVQRSLEARLRNDANGWIENAQLFDVERKSDFKVILATPPNDRRSVVWSWQGLSAIALAATLLLLLGRNYLFEARGKVSVTSISHEESQAIPSALEPQELSQLDKAALLNLVRTSKQWLKEKSRPPVANPLAILLIENSSTGVMRSSVRETDRIIRNATAWFEQTLRRNATHTRNNVGFITDFFVSRLPQSATRMLALDRISNRTKP